MLNLEPCRLKFGNNGHLKATDRKRKAGLKI